MPSSSGRIELWRRLALLIGFLAGLALFFYVVPAVVSVKAVDWHQEQADELKSPSGYVSSKDRRLNQLPLADYINEKTGGQVTKVDDDRFKEFFQQVQSASRGEYDTSIYGNRVSEEDKDPFWKPQEPVPVFFKPGEFPFAQWGLTFGEGQQAYISRTDSSGTSYLLLTYEDYLSSISAMYKPYRVAPGWLYHPYRSIGAGFMAAGLLLYIILPRRRKNPGDIAYSGGRLVAGDIVALLLFVPFYALPFLINGGTVQAATGMWPVSLVMWILALFGLALLYYTAWYASYRIEMTPEALYLITFKGIRECRFDQTEAVNLVSLRNPGWFRKAYMALALLSFGGGSGSLQPVGGALLAQSAAYGGLEICRRGADKPLYIWFTDQMGGVIIPNFDRVLEAIRTAGIQIKQEPREIEGFSMFM